jgi:hypothetical protein
MENDGVVGVEIPDHDTAIFLYFNAYTMYVPKIGPFFSILDGKRRIGILIINFLDFIQIPGCILLRDTTSES